MARKNPYRQIAVGIKISEALEPLRVEASKKTFHRVSFNAFCEQILWTYAIKNAIPQPTPTPLSDAMPHMGVQQ